MKIRLILIICCISLLGCNSDPAPASTPEKENTDKTEVITQPAPGQEPQTPARQITHDVAYGSSSDFVNTLKDLHNTNYLHDVGNIQFKLAYQNTKGVINEERSLITPYNFVEYDLMDEVFILPYFFKFQAAEWGEPELASIGQVKCQSISLKLPFEELPCQEFIIFQRNRAEKIYAIAAKATEMSRWKNEDSEYTIFFPGNYTAMGDLIYAVSFQVGSWDPEKGLIKQLGKVEVMNTAYIEM